MKLNIHGKNSPVILLFGPTAVGKSDLLLSYFNKNFEIISADSMQVYRYMDIGTAKPSKVELEKIPHHLIDICNPDEQFHAGQFIRMADQLIKEILDRGNIPVLSGGTGYYFKNFLYGLPEVPPTNNEVAKELNRRLQNGEREALFAELKEVDLESANRIHINDSYRLVRALEVYKSSLRPLSSYNLPRDVRSTINPLIIGLSREREELYSRINRRVDIMLEQGLVAEIDRLIAKGYGVDSAGMSAIGYRELFEAKAQGRGDELEYIASRIKLNSRHYAKRQITFFKTIPNINWVDADNREALSLLVDNWLKEFSI